MTDRTALALAACDGMTNEDLAQRGQRGFPKMILRKRHYADLARKAAGALLAMKQELEKTKQELAIAKATIAQLEALDKPVEDLTAAKDLLAGFMKGEKNEG